MKYIKHLMLGVFLLLTSCSPQTKRSYLEEYKGFIIEISKKSTNYTKEDWTFANIKFEKFSEEWYSKFEKQLTWQEEILIKKYQVQYNLYKLSSGSKESFDIENNEDYQKMKKELEYYYENNMQDDIDSFMKQANEAGDSTLVIVNRIMEQLNKEYKAKAN